MNNLLNLIGGTDAIVGMILPALLAFVMQSHWPWKVKANVAWIACFLTAIGVALAQGLLTGIDATSAQTIAIKFGVILTICTQLYDKFYKPTGIAPKIESATDVTSAPATTSLPDPLPSTPQPQDKITVRFDPISIPATTELPDPMPFNSLQGIDKTEFDNSEEASLDAATKALQGVV